MSLARARVRLDALVLIAATAAFASSCEDEGDDDEVLAGDGGLTGNDSGPIIIRLDAGQANVVDASRAQEQLAEDGAVEADAHTLGDEEAGVLDGDAGERDATAQGDAAGSPEAGERDAAYPDAADGASSDGSPDGRPDSSAQGASDAQAPADGSNPDARGPGGGPGRGEGNAPDARANDAAQARGDALGEGGLSPELAADPPSD